MRIHQGHLFHIEGSRSLSAARDGLREVRDGGLLIDAHGRIRGHGPLKSLLHSSPAATVVGHPGHLLLPGFVDAHIHFPQVHARARFGGGELLPWLEHCVFPSEARLADPATAKHAADAFTRALALSGTTCAMIFGSQFPVAQEALVDALKARGLRAVLGRTLMTEGPSTLTTSLDEGLRLCEDEILRWHPKRADARDALLGVALVPRFALSLDEDGLRRVGELFARHRDHGLWLTTHLSENATPEVGEIAQVLARFKTSRYLDVYDGRFLKGSARGGESLLSRRTVMAHAVHVTDDEIARLAESETAVAHCPSSQLFLGSGTMPLARLMQAGLRIGMGSDVGAGDTYSIPDVLNAAFKVHMSGTERLALHPAELLHLGTLGGAQALDLDDRIGNFDVGKDADFVVIDPSRDPLLEDLLNAVDIQGGTPADRLFALLLTLGRQGILATFVQGREVSTAPLQR